MSRRRARYRFQSRRERADKALAEGMERGLRDAGIVWQGDAARRTPVDSGLLRASIAYATSDGRTHNGRAPGLDGTVASSQYDVRAPRNTVRVGTNVEYAVMVHENLSARHEVGEAKFIEAPLRERQRDYERLIRTAIREAMT